MPDYLSQEPSLNQQRKGPTGIATLPPTNAFLASCIHISLQCSCCGDVRQAIAQLPSSATVSCPECGMACSFTLVGKGLTSRKLPFSEVRWSEAQLLNRRDELPELNSSVPCLSG